MSSLTAQESIGTIDKFIQQVGATEKQAAALSEPGSQGGETSHPVKDVDDRLEVAKEGERSSENESDVKEDQGKPGVNSTPEATAKAGADGGAVSTPGSAAEDHLQIGTNTQATGDDSTNETGKAKAGKEDPGSSHPARTDNDSLDGHKYSSDQLNDMSLNDLAKIAADMGNDLCAAIAVAAPEAEQKLVETKQAGDSSDATTPEASNAAAKAGWELADLLNGNFDKRAADTMVQQSLEEIVKTAADDADRVLEFLMAYQAEKAAMEGMPPEEPAPAPPGGGMPTGEEGGGGGGEEMLAALGGGEEALPEEGGDMGGDEEAMLLQILAENGITPEELEEMIAANEGGESTEEPTGMEVEASDKHGSKKPQAQTVKRGHTENDIRSYVQEVIGRSRR